MKKETFIRDNIYIYLHFYLEHYIFYSRKMGRTKIFKAAAMWDELRRKERKMNALMSKEEEKRRTTEIIVDSLPNNSIDRNISMIQSPSSPPPIVQDRSASFDVSSPSYDYQQAKGTHVKDADTIQKESNNKRKRKSPKAKEAAPLEHGPKLLSPDEEQDRHATRFVFKIFSQLEICHFRIEDIKGRRAANHDIGYPGMACQFCLGVSKKSEYGMGRGGRYFPTSFKTLVDSGKTLFAIHKHLMDCEKCPKHVKDELKVLRKEHDIEKKQLKRGSNVKFCTNIWNRLYGDRPKLDYSTPSARVADTANLLLTLAASGSDLESQNKINACDSHGMQIATMVSIDSVASEDSFEKGSELNKLHTIDEERNNSEDSDYEGEHQSPRKRTKSTETFQVETRDDGNSNDRANTRSFPSDDIRSFYHGGEDFYHHSRAFPHQRIYDVSPYNRPRAGYEQPNHYSGMPYSRFHPYEYFAPPPPCNRFYPPVHHHNYRFGAERTLPKPLVHPKVASGLQASRTPSPTNSVGPLVKPQMPM